MGMRAEDMPVSQVEGLFYSIAMMDVNVHIKHTCMHLQQLQNGQHQIIYITEAYMPSIASDCH